MFGSGTTGPSRGMPSGMPARKRRPIKGVGDMTNRGPRDDAPAPKTRPANTQQPTGDIQHQGNATPRNAPQNYVELPPAENAQPESAKSLVKKYWWVGAIGIAALAVGGVALSKRK